MSRAGFLREVRSQGRALLLLDYDGTLAAIRRRRQAAVLTRPWLERLRGLARTPGLQVVFVSGRALADLRRRTPVPRAGWVGNHGLAWWRPALGPSPSLRRAWRSRVRAALAELKPWRRRFPGLDLDAKGPDLSLHLRRLRPRRRAALVAALRPLLRRHRLTLHHGRHVLELRPRDGWDKGRALRRLRRALGPGLPCLYAGDDRTDEHAFAALGRGTRCLSLKIGPGPTRAMERSSRQGLLALLTQVQALAAQRREP